MLCSHSFASNDSIFHLYLAFQLSSSLPDAVATSVMLTRMSFAALRFPDATERRRTLRYRNLLVRQMVQMKIKTSALLMATFLREEPRGGLKLADDS